MQKLSDLTPEQRLDLGDRLRAMPDNEKQAFLENLTENQRLELLHDPIIWLRRKQWIPPDPEKNIALCLAGRGFGKTHTLSRMLKWYVHEQGVRDFVIAGPSMHDLVQVVVNGNSGIMRSYADNDPEKPTYSPHFGVLRYPNGAVGRLISSESPERARGCNAELVFMDEMGSLSGDALDFWYQLEYGLRKGVSQAIIATTPRATPLMIDIIKRSKDPDENIRVITGSTLENEEHLTDQMIQRAKKTMHTRIGKAEVLGELILTNEKALWTPDLIEKCNRKSIDEFHKANWRKFMIGVDPSAGSGKKDSDKTGIVVSALTESGKVIVVEDKSGRWSGEQAVSIIGELHAKYSKICAGKVRVEKNGVGSYFKEMIKRDFPFLPVEDFASTNKKYSRALNCSHLFETEVAYFDEDADLEELKSECITWEGTNRSPDHIDAMTFSIDGLVKTGNFTKRKQFIL